MTTSHHTPLPILLTLLLGLSPAGCGGTEDTGSSAGPRPSSDRSDASAVAGITTLGTIHASVNGEPRTWYVVSGTIADRPYHSGTWVESMPDEHQIMARGFDTPTPPLHAFELQGTTPAGYGDYDGSLMTIVVGRAMGSPPAILTFPNRGDIDAGVFYQPVATVTDVEDGTFHLVSGHLEVTDFAVVNEIGQTSGTFSGTLQSSGRGGTIEVTEGRFDLREVPRAGW